MSADTVVARSRIEDLAQREDDTYFELFCNVEAATFAYQEQPVHQTSGEHLCTPTYAVTVASPQSAAWVHGRNQAGVRDLGQTWLHQQEEENWYETSLM